jgi:hypothetical protein
MLPFVTACVGSAKVNDKKCQGYAPSPARLPTHSGERNSTPRGRKLGRRLPGADRRADLPLATGNRQDSL